MWASTCSTPARRVNLAGRSSTSPRSSRSKVSSHLPLLRLALCILLSQADTPPLARVPRWSDCPCLRCCQARHPRSDQGVLQRLVRKGDQRQCQSVHSPSPPFSFSSTLPHTALSDRSLLLLPSLSVSPVAPGYISTEMNTALIADPTRSRQILERIPSKRWGTPDDFSGAVLFLAGAGSDYVCGECLTVSLRFVCGNKERGWNRD